MSGQPPVKVGDTVTDGQARGVVLAVEPRLVGMRGQHIGWSIYVDWSGAIVPPAPR